MKTEERELILDDLYAIAKRIIAAKHHLFTGTPYKSVMKPNKQRTYNKLCKMHDKNIKQVTKLFF